MPEAAKEIGRQLITPESIQTYGTLSMLVVAITGSIVYAFNLKQPRWLGLLVSIVVCFLAACMRKSSFALPDATGLFTAFGNAFLIFFASIGENTIAATMVTNLGQTADSGAAHAAEGPRKNRPFFVPWF